MGGLAASLLNYSFTAAVRTDSSGKQVSGPAGTYEKSSKAGNWRTGSDPDHLYRLATFVAPGALDHSVYDGGELLTPDPGPQNSDKDIASAVGRGDVTNVGDVDVQLIYGHVRLRILDQRHKPLLTQPTDWPPIWLRVRNQNGVTVHESGLSVVEIERAVDLNESRINLALPQGTWTLEIALAGVPPNTGRIRRAVRWLRVPRKVRIESCVKPVDVAVSVSRPTKF